MARKPTRGPAPRQRLMPTPADRAQRWIKAHRDTGMALVARVLPARPETAAPPPVPPFLEAIRTHRLREMGLLPDQDTSLAAPVAAAAADSTADTLRLAFHHHLPAAPPPADASPEEDPEAARTETPAQAMTAHALNATLLLTALPLGAAMTTYTLLRGTHLAASARAMALAGIGLAVIDRLPLLGLIGA